MSAVLVSLGASLSLVAVYGWFEAGWLRTRVRRRARRPGFPRRSTASGSATSPTSLASAALARVYGWFEAGWLGRVWRSP